MPSRADQISTVRGHRIKIAVTVGGFVLAAILFALASRPPRPVEADDQRRVDLLCTRCDGHFSVGFEEFARAASAVSDAEKKPAAGTGRERSLRERAVAMTCPSCGQATGRPAAHCPRHDVYYLKHTVKGANARCPKCHPAPGATS